MRCREQDQVFGFTATISFCPQTLKGRCSLCFTVQGMKMSTTLLSDRTVRCPRFYRRTLRETTCGFMHACKRQEADSEMKMHSSPCERCTHVSFLVRVPSQAVCSGPLQLEPWKASASYSILQQLIAWVCLTKGPESNSRGWCSHNRPGSQLRHLRLGDPNFIKFCK